MTRHPQVIEMTRIDFRSGSEDRARIIDFFVTLLERPSRKVPHLNLRSFAAPSLSLNLKLICQKFALTSICRTIYFRLYQVSAIVTR
jgi:hypothetical protein